MLPEPWRAMESSHQGRPVNVTAAWSMAASRDVLCPDSRAVTGCWPGLSPG